MRNIAILIVVLVAAVVLAGIALSLGTRSTAPTAVIDGWPIGPYMGLCAEPVCAEKTRVGLAALEEQYPTHAAVLSSALYGLGACAGPSSGPTVAAPQKGASVEDVLVVTLADGAVHAFGLVSRRADAAPSVAPALDSPYCASAAVASLVARGTPMRASSDRSRNR